MGRGRSRTQWAALLACLLLPLSSAQAAAAEPVPPPGPLVVVGVTGLTWSGVGPERTPRLWELLGAADVGSLVTRTQGPGCAADGWLTIGAGRQAQAVAGEPCTAPEVRDGQVQGWAEVLERAEEQQFDAEPGLLGGALASAGSCSVAVGAGAALATAGRDGRAETLPELSAGGVTGCTLALVDLGRLEGAELDQRAGDVVERSLGAGGDVLLLGLPDAQDPPQLGALALLRPEPVGDPAWLTSPSTRRDALSQLTDLTPTLLRAAGAGVPGTAVGTALQTSGPRPALAEAVRELQRDASDEQAVRRAQGPFWAVVVGVGLLTLGGLALLARLPRLGGSSRHRAASVLRVLGPGLAAVPAATFLADLWSWERARWPVVALLLTVLTVSAGVTAVACLGPWRDRLVGPFAFVGGTTALVLGLDVALGSELQESSLMGYFPTIAGRYYGLGNQAFSLFATGALLLAAGVAAAAGSRRRAAASVLLVGLVALVVDGAPGLGADVGGVLAIVPAFAVLALLVSGQRVSVLRLAGLVGAAAMVLAALAALDASRPAGSRTHLGRFARDVVDGRAAEVLQRKASANWDLLTSSPAALSLPLAFALIGVALWRPERVGLPALRTAYDREPLLVPLLQAFLVLQVLGAAFNDSGVAVPAVALVMLVPLVVGAAAASRPRAPYAARGHRRPEWPRSTTAACRRPH